MDCTTTITTATRKQRLERGLALVEMLVGLSIAGIFFAAFATTLSYNARSCVALGNYVDLDKASRSALDTMTKEIRQANKLTSYSSTNLTFEMVDGTTGATNTLGYTYNSGAKTLSRQFADQSKVLLRDITTNSLTFSIYQRNPIGGAVDQYATTDASVCKVVQLSWVCSRSALGSVTTESVQSAKIVIRKE